MKKVALTIFVLCLCIPSWSQSLEPKDVGSSIAFKIKNFGLMVDGFFTGLKGKIIFNPYDLSTASFDVFVNAASINTGIDMRDKHLMKAEYFDVKNFSTIRFVSTKVELATTQGKYWATGNLTIKQKTKEIKFPFTVQQTTEAYLFMGAFPLNRRDFDIGSGSLSMADELNIELLVKAVISKN